MRKGILGTVMAAALAFAAAASADETHPWDASWFGGFGGNAEGVQIIVAGDQIVGFFFSGDYVDVNTSDPIAADGSLTFKWDGGTATLSASGKDHVLTVHQAGAPAKVIALSRDPG